MKIRLFFIYYYNDGIADCYITNGNISNPHNKSIIIYNKINIDKLYCITLNHKTVNWWKYNDKYDYWNVLHSFKITELKL